MLKIKYFKNYSKKKKKKNLTRIFLKIFTRIFIKLFDHITIINDNIFIIIMLLHYSQLFTLLFPLHVNLELTYQNLSLEETFLPNLCSGSERIEHRP